MRVIRGGRDRGPNRPGRVERRHHAHADQVHIDAEAHGRQAARETRVTVPAAS